METQTWLSRHNKFISAENIVGIFSVSSDDSFYMLCLVPEMRMRSYSLYSEDKIRKIQKINRKITKISLISLIFLFIFWIRTVTPHSHLWDRTEHVKRVIWRDGEYTNNILRRNKFIMTA